MAEIRLLLFLVGGRVGEVERVRKF